MEAARDRRLDGDALRSALQHRARCTACAREHDALEALAGKLRAAKRVDEVALRRSRNAVLERASRQPERPAVARWKLLVPACAVAAAAALLVLRATLPAAPAAAPLVVITSSENASFERTTVGDVDRVDLADGALAFDVRGHVEGRRFVVVVPDGEIEDVGTRFRVATRGDRTEEIAVEEGAVVFRRPGRAAVELGPGEVYRPEATVPAAAKSGAVSLEPPAGGPSSPPSPAPAPVACVSVEGAAVPAAGSSSSARSAPASVSSSSTPGRTGQTAASAAAPSVGPSPAAEAPPRAPAPRETFGEEQAEDEAYLQVIALLRENRRDEAKVAARRYVARFPNGLRRREMDAIAE